MTCQADEEQARNKNAGSNVNNLKYAGDNILMAENEEELRSLLMKVKEVRHKVYMLYDFSYMTF